VVKEETWRSYRKGNGAFEVDDMFSEEKFLTLYTRGEGEN